jgi:hypothetical protein
LPAATRPEPARLVTAAEGLVAGDDQAGAFGAEGGAVAGQAARIPSVMLKEAAH